MKFASPDLLADLATASDAEIDALPFGVIRMDADHAVAYYNACESDLSGMSPETVIGKNFFTEVAPCTNNFLVATRYEEIEQLDETLDYIFTYRMAPTKVRLRLLRDAPAGRQFLCVEKAS